MSLFLSIALASTLTVTEGPVAEVSGLTVGDTTYLVGGDSVGATHCSYRGCTDIVSPTILARGIPSSTTLVKDLDVPIVFPYYYQVVTATSSSNVVEVDESIIPPAFQPPLVIGLEVLCSATLDLTVEYIGDATSVVAESFDSYGVLTNTYYPAFEYASPGSIFFYASLSDVAPYDCLNLSWRVTIYNDVENFEYCVYRDNGYSMTDCDPI